MPVRLDMAITIWEQQYAEILEMLIGVLPKEVFESKKVNLHSRTLFNLSIGVIRHLA
jgi:hypothetical protein